MAAERSYPEDRKYHREHGWALADGDAATLGITWFAQDSLGQIVYYEAPPVGERIQQGAAYGQIESMKTVSDLIAPLSGEVLEVNERVIEEPEIVNDDPYDKGWLARIRLSEPGELGGLLDAAEYQRAVEEP